MTAQTSLHSLLETGAQIWAPCVYDCLSARTVEVAGYPALMLSSAELAWSMCGIPDGLLSADEVLWAVQRIAAYSPLPLVVDGENGGGSPLAVYRYVSRLIDAGASGVTIEDTVGHWMAGYNSREAQIMPADLWAANIKAAADAAAGTDFVVIARTECKGGGAPEVRFNNEDAKLGLDEAIRRCNLGLDAGAGMTLIMDINHAGAMDEVREVARRVPGWKMYPDVKAGAGEPDVDLDAIMALGFNFVTSHAAMKGATKGMLDYHTTNFRNRHTAYSENDDFGIGLTIHPYNFDDWAGRAAEYHAYQERIRAGKPG